MKRLKTFLTDAPVLFVCIGTDRSTGDSLGPLVGTKLKQLGYTVLGTLHDPVHAVNLEEHIEVIKHDYPDHQVIAIDACLGRLKNVGKIIIQQGPVYPGAGVEKKLPPVGNLAITPIVNVSGFMEFFILQNTRLSLVMDLADKIVNIISNELPTGLHQQYVEDDLAFTRELWKDVVIRKDKKAKLSRINLHA